MSTSEVTKKFDSKPEFIVEAECCFVVLRTHRAKESKTE